MTEKTKGKMLKTFEHNTEISLSMECVICGEYYEEDNAVGACAETAFKEFAKNAYKKGWRESVSENYGHIGIHCPSCQMNQMKFAQSELNGS